MDKMKWLKRVNVLLFFFLVHQAVTGLLADVMNGAVFAVMHPTGGILLVLCGLIHIGLNWGWVRSVYLTKKE
jgi:hypothetical protein